MGGRQSTASPVMPEDLPVGCHPDAHVAVSLCEGGEIRVMNADSGVRRIFTTLKDMMTQKYPMEGKFNLEYYGTIKYCLPLSYCFTMGADKDTSTLGKVFVLKLLELMTQSGYIFRLSCDLAQTHDLATLFFTKPSLPTASPSPSLDPVRICCIATGGTGNLTLLGHDEGVREAVYSAIRDTWDQGITKTRDVEVMGDEVVHEVELGGAWGGVKEHGVSTRYLILGLFQEMGNRGWRLLVSTNIKSSADSFFFIRDEGHTAGKLCMVALAREDRLRLFNCTPPEKEAVKRAVKESGSVVRRESDYYGCHDLDLDGAPWSGVGEEAIRGRRIVSRVLEEMSGIGWQPYTAVDVTKSDTDKSSVVFERRLPGDGGERSVGCAAVALSGTNAIQFLDFPGDVTTSLIQVVREHYPFGVKSEKSLSGNDVEVCLKLTPWVAKSRCYPAFHARAMLGKLISVAMATGWMPCISGDISAVFESSESSSYPLDVHTLYFTCRK